MNRDSVYQLLGPPQDNDSKGRQHWTIEDGHYREDLWLRFGPDGDMTEYERNSEETYASIIWSGTMKTLN